MVHFNPMYYMYVDIVRWQSDLVNTSEIVLPVCDEPYHTNNGIQQEWEEIQSLRYYAVSYNNSGKWPAMRVDSAF